MTTHELAEWDWLERAEGGTVLHHAQMWLVGDDETVGFGDTTCGRRMLLAIPGILTRLGLPRCRRCCSRLGFKNDATCRPLVEARLVGVQ